MIPKLIFAGYTGSKNQVRTRKKIKFDLKLIFFRVCFKLPNWHFKNQVQIDTASAFYLRSRYTLKLRKARDNPPPPSSFLALISLSPIFFSLSWFTLAMKQQPHYAARRSHLPPPTPVHSVLSQRLFHHILSVTSGFPPLTHHLKIEISRLSKFRAVGTRGGQGGCPHIFWQISQLYFNQGRRVCPQRAPPPLCVEMGFYVDIS